jgi:NAD(P)-dependent dehydrogenase (short-subunit alcohol dehydrogenase family)
MPDNGRVALVTGGGRGIGRATARALAGEGFAVAIAARTAAEVEAAAKEVVAAGGRALPLVLDVTNSRAVSEAFRTAAERLGPVLVLVNNAGIAPSAKFLDTDEASWDQVLRVNLTSAYLCARAALPAMLAARFGRVINVASTAGKIGYRYTTAYTASKHGLLGLTRALALEMAERGVTVNAVCPGFTRTDIVAEGARRIAQKSGRSVADAEAELARLSPQRRLIEPEEVAAVIAFLARDDSGGINGQAWNVDGGAVMA